MSSLHLGGQKFDCTVLDDAHISDRLTLESTLGESEVVSDTDNSDTGL